jgi:hypothetical protein
LLESQARYGGSKFLPIKAKPFRKQGLLKLLLLVEPEFHSEPRGIRQHMLRECQDALDVELTENRLTEFHLRECQLRT